MGQGINNRNLKKKLMFVEIAQTDIHYIWFVVCYLLWVSSHITSECR
jgi:hypothetical protein